MECWTLDFTIQNFKCNRFLSESDDFVTGKKASPFNEDVGKNDTKLIP